MSDKPPEYTPVFTSDEVYLGYVERKEAHDAIIGAAARQEDPPYIHRHSIVFLTEVRGAGEGRHVILCLQQRSETKTDNPLRWDKIGEHGKLLGNPDRIESEVSRYLYKECQRYGEVPPAWMHEEPHEVALRGIVEELRKGAPTEDITATFQTPQEFDATAAHTDLIHNALITEIGRVSDYRSLRVQKDGNIKVEPCIQVVYLCRYHGGIYPMEIDREELNAIEWVSRRGLDRIMRDPEVVTQDLLDLYRMFGDHIFSPTLSDVLGN